MWSDNNNNMECVYKHISFANQVCIVAYLLPVSVIYCSVAKSNSKGAERKGACLSKANLFLTPVHTHAFLI